MFKLEFEYSASTNRAHSSYQLTYRNDGGNRIVGKYAQVDTASQTVAGQYNSVVSCCVAGTEVYAYCHQYNDSFCCHSSDDRDYVVAVHSSFASACIELYYKGVSRKTDGGWESNYIDRFELRDGLIFATSRYCLGVHTVSKNNREYTFRVLYKDGDDATWPFETAEASKYRFAVYRALENGENIEDVTCRDVTLAMFELRYRDRGREHIERLLDYLDGAITADDYISEFRNTADRDNYLNSV